MMGTGGEESRGKGSALRSDARRSHRSTTVDSAHPAIGGGNSAADTERLSKMAIETNRDQLVKVAVVGQVAPQEFAQATTPYLISHDGAPRIVPGTGGITYNVRVGDRVRGLVGDHIEPAVSARNSEPKANAGFNILSCVGNAATVVSGDAKGAVGVVTGTHGGIEHVMIDFADDVLAKLVVGDQIQVAAWGVGLAITRFPEIRCTGLDPDLFAAWVTTIEDEQLVVPVAKMAPAAIMGSGLGRDNTARGDYDINLFDPEMVAEYELDGLRFGDFVAILDADATYGRHYSGGAISIGIIAHGDSYLAGHGPGVTGLLTSRQGEIRPMIDEGANIADLLGLRSERSG